MEDSVELVPNSGWDSRILVCRCAPTVDCFIVVTTRYVIFVDTLLNPATASALLAIAQPFLQSGRMPLVINTHADWDHCWGNQIFAGPKALLHAPIIAHARGIARYGTEMAEQLSENRAAYPGRFDGVVPTPPTIAFTEQLTIDGGDLQLELFLAPGHTSDHLAIFIPEIGMLLAGDAVEEPFPFATTIEGLVTLRQTLRELAALRPRIALYCHAPTDRGPALIERNSAYFDTLEARCRSALSEYSGPPVNGDLEAWAQFPYEQALGALQARYADVPMYRTGHKQHIVLIAEWIEGEQHQPTD